MFPLPACSAPEPTAPDVVLVSLDTTRADALSVYGNPRPTTPTLDRLAAEGVRFAWALSAAPTTVASHASVFTGHDSHGTGIVRNGYPLELTDTLPTRFAAAGYDTLAVLGSSALAKPMGFEHGFRAWDETFTVRRKHRVEATATEVTDRALAALGGREPGKPAFLFVHYYDAHSPYDAPAPWTHRWSDPALAGRFEPRIGGLTELATQIRAGIHRPEELQEVVDTYLGEVSYVDAELARLLDGLRPGSLVVVFGDHGDMFGEESQRPFGHGVDLDLPETHVPLILNGPGIPAAVVEEPAGLQDLGSTILDVAGLPGTLGGRASLRSWWTGAPDDRTWFLEATQPESQVSRPRWNNLHAERGVLRGGHLYLRAPWLGTRGLYRVATGMPEVADPQEPWDTLLQAWDAAAPPWRDVTMGDDTKEKLKALGYAE